MGANAKAKRKITDTMRLNWFQKQGGYIYLTYGIGYFNSGGGSLRKRIDKAMRSKVKK